MQQIRPGFDYNNLLTMRISLPYVKFLNAKTFFKEVIERVKSLPGVESASAVTHLPLSGEDDTSPYKAHPASYVILDRPAPEKGAEPKAQEFATAPGYFHTMRIPMIRGREFTEDDVVGKPGVMVINEALAQREWPDEDPIGKKMSIGSKVYKDEPLEWEIVGVAQNVRHFSLSSEVVPSMYVPHGQQRYQFMTLTIRTTSEPLLMADSVRKQVWAVDKDQPIGNVSAMDQLIYEQVSQPRFYLMMLSIFAGVALVLASVGIYGVMSHMVTQRTHEIGVRRAMGAQNRDVMRMVLRQGVGLTAVGAAIGVAGAAGLTRVMGSLLYEVSAVDPVTFVASPVILMAVACAASYVPARRATKVDPQVALRYE